MSIIINCDVKSGQKEIVINQNSNEIQTNINIITKLINNLYYEFGISKNFQINNYICYLEIEERSTSIALDSDTLQFITYNQLLHIRVYNKITEEQGFEDYPFLKGKIIKHKLYSNKSYGFDNTVVNSFLSNYNDYLLAKNERELLSNMLPIQAEKVKKIMKDKI